MSADCPAWCTREHEATQAFHKGAPVTFRAERLFLGERHDISIYVEQYVNEDGSKREPAIVIDGPLSESEELAEFSVADAARVAVEIGRLLEVLRAVPA